MPRPSRKKERTQEILSAFKRCILRDGLQGSTLERVAEEAGLSRQLVRHFVGNRDAMIVALAQSMADDFERLFEEIQAAVGRRKRVATLLDMFFAAPDPRDRDDSLVFDAMIAEARRLPEVEAIVGTWFASFNALVADVLAQEYPDAKPAARKEVALGVVSLLFVVDSFQTLSDARGHRRRAKAAAKRLVASL